jgi:Flp pilus assembly pilin Flp
MKINQERRIRTAKRTRLGRVVCRLAGNQTGAVLMEYVILGVLIAAAATLAVIYFGKEITTAFTTMTHATAGRVDNAKTSATAQQTAADDAQKNNETTRKTISGGASANDANK